MNENYYLIWQIFYFFSICTFITLFFGVNKPVLCKIIIFFYLLMYTEKFLKKKYIMLIVVYI